MKWQMNKSVNTIKGFLYISFFSSCTKCIFQNTNDMTFLWINATTQWTHIIIMKHSTENTIHSSITLQPSTKMSHSFCYSAPNNIMCVFLLCIHHTAYFKDISSKQLINKFINLMNWQFENITEVENSHHTESIKQSKTALFITGDKLHLLSLSSVRLICHSFPKTRKINFLPLHYEYSLANSHTDTMSGEIFNKIEIYISNV